jgi:hypothetical protein
MIQDRRGADTGRALISLGIPKLVRFAKIRLQQLLWYFHTSNLPLIIAAIYCAAIEEMWSL